MLPALPDTEPSFAFVFLEPNFEVVRARRGQLLYWWIAHEAFNLWVVSADGTQVVDKAHCPIGRAPSLLMQWDDEGKIEPMCDIDVIRFQLLVA